jgi:hypothetical protein
MAETIGDTQRRLGQVENIARTWMRSDPQAARTWIAASSLPDDRKQRLLNQGDAAGAMAVRSVFAP